MNKAITDGLVFQPTPFSAGLNVWSSQDGRPGQATYANAANAAFVPADQDFGGALELVKTQGTQKLRYSVQTPILPGCYLKITARVKALAGNLPSVRIGAYAGRTNGSAVPGVVLRGPAKAIPDYGQVVEVSAIVGIGTRGGVDMAWGRSAVFGHFGIDLTGPNGGVIRVDDITIEDASSVFLSQLINAVDVRDFGAIGDNQTDDSAAFNAADEAANGRDVLVPQGTYFLNSNITMDSRMRFEGTVRLPVNRLFVMRKNFDLPGYIDAFGDEVEAFKKAFQALFNNADHESLDLGGRRIDVTEPIDMAEAVSNKTQFEIRRVVRNGQFNVQNGSAWNATRVTSSARYDVSNPRFLTNVADVANIEVGAHITGRGVGREVYVTAKNVGAGTIRLSQPLFGPNPTQDYNFTRYRYVLDFGGFAKLSKFTLDNIDFQLDGIASGIMMAPDGETFHLRDSFITKPRHRGITSPGIGCQDLQIDRCHFISDEQQVPATQRVTVGFNVNANDSKIRDSRFQRLGTTMVLFGNGHLIVGNHWFQGDNVTNGPRTAGIVLTETNVKTVITGNYIDNSFIEWTNEHDHRPDFSNEFSFGGLSVTGNIFTANDVAPFFSWIVIKPYGPGHFVHGLSVTGNVFKALNGAIERVDRVDDTFAGLNMSLSRMVEFTGNTFNSVSQETINPATLEFTQNGSTNNWVLAPGAWLPFGGFSRTVAAVVPDGSIKDADNNNLNEMPSVVAQDGPQKNRVRLVWSRACTGKVQLTARMDKPF